MPPQQMTQAEWDAEQQRQENIRAEKVGNPELPETPGSQDQLRLGLTVQAD